MKTLYLDLFSGIAGDMFIGALLDLGVDAGELERQLLNLDLDGYHLHSSRQQKSGISGIKFDVHLSHGGGHAHTAGDHHHESGHHDHHHHDEHNHHHGHGHEHEDGPHEHRNFAQIRQLIAESGLSPWVKEKSTAVFQRLAMAEGRIHGLPPENVHFHEVGAVDSIVDIVGAAIALELLGKPRVLASPVVDGTGWMNCAHGRFPVPAPATLAVLGARGIALSQCEEPHELVTPTGAALLAEFVEDFGPMENLVADQIGFGLGTRENETRPNVLRAILGRQVGPRGTGTDASAGGLDWETDTIAVLETNLDDCTGEILGAFFETAMTAGALDVSCTPIQMKKNRPGILLTVLCAEAEAEKFSAMILRETTAFGVRKTIAERRKLRREFIAVKTPAGDVAVKIGRLKGKAVQTAPEFESAKKLAARAGLPVKKVFEAVVQKRKNKRDE
jgi:uncharacterized protein (TIGR00299 family) protein